MLPADITDEHRAYWRDFETREAVFGAPEEVEVGIEPCKALITKPREPADLNMACVRVPWKPDDDDIAAIAAGGTIWLSTWGGLPPHQLEVQPPTPAPPPKRAVGRMGLSGNTHVDNRDASALAGLPDVERAMTHVYPDSDV